MLEAGVRTLLGLPRGQQVMAARLLLEQLPPPEVREVWNTSFGPQSLYEAWSRTSVAQGVYAANRRVLRPLMNERPGWRIIEVGAGNGALWRSVLAPDDQGEIIAIDPVEGALEALAGRMPAGVTLVPRVGRVEDVGGLPEADALVCSLTLHHLAGRDAAERHRHGMSGPGKVEVLRRFAESLRPRAGVLLLNEADVHCEVDLPSGSAVLRDRLFDSYVRRCGLAMLEDLQREELDEDLAARFRHILRHWCLEQLAMADLAVEERDVYELDVGRWREVLERAGLAIDHYGRTDDYGLFWQYQCRPQGAPL